MELKHTATRDGRLSAILREDMQVSAGLMNRLKWQELLFVNGIPQHTDYPVKAGDVITLPLDEPEPDYPAEDGDLTSMITVESTPVLTFKNGKATPEKAGNYELTYTVTDKNGQAVSEYATLVVTKKTADAVVYQEFDFDTNHNVDANG